MKIARLAVGIALLAAAPAASRGEVVVLRGGTRIELKQPPVVRGNTVILTRADGTLLSVPLSEIDRRATATAKAAPVLVSPSSVAVAPPATPAEAARAARGGPRARIRVTDADVGHYAEDPTAGAPPEPGEATAASGPGGVDIVEYTQKKAGENLVVRGTLRNGGGTPTINTRLTVTAMDEKGETIGSAEASLSNGLIEPGRTVAFTVSLPIGTRNLGLLRFSPQWIAQPPPEPAGAPGAPLPPPAGSVSAASAPPVAPPGAAPAPGSATARAPAPAPTPFGRGTLYAPPAAAAQTTAPADGKTGYIPGPASPENQPRPPE